MSDTEQTSDRAVLAELRMACCPTPEPTIERDSDDPTVWEIVCETCDETLAYIIAPEDDPLEDANGYSRSDLLFGGNW